MGTMTEENKSNGKKKLFGESHKNAKSTDLFSCCSFSSLGLHTNLCDQLKERLGFEVPTSVQAQAIPAILSGRDVLVNAATGTGKTLAYLAPVIQHLHRIDPPIKRSDGTFALVIVPTRELCLQVYEILQRLLHRFHWIVPGYIMGGDNRSKEKARLRKGVSILVATPGRLLDHLKKTSSFHYTVLHWVIFDEADRILELGFGKNIEEILDILGARQDRCAVQEQVTSRPEKQILLLSATLDEKVNHLAKISLQNPVMVGFDGKNKELNSSLEVIGGAKETADGGIEKSCDMLNPSSEEYNLPVQLIQRYIKVPCGARLAVLFSILKHLSENGTSQKVVVFFSTRDTVDFHYAMANKFHWLSGSSTETGSQQIFLNCKVFRLHGEMENADRRTAFQEFKTAKSALLMCTDIAARGLDFPKVRCIIQYDPPGEATEYVHRVGRTARLGERGDALLFLQPVETDYLEDLEKHGVVLSEYPVLKTLDTFSLSDVKPHMKKVVTVEVHPWVVYLQRALEGFVLAEPNVKKLAQQAFSSWIRAYTAHRAALKRIFMVKKLHLGHVAKSFALKQQPSLVNRSLHKQAKKRKKVQKQGGIAKKRKANG